MKYKAAVLTASSHGSDPSVKVKIHGFELALGTEITIEAFLKYLLTRSGEQIDDQVLAITEKGGFYVGVLLTIKDVTKFVLLKQLRVTVQELEAGTNIVDLNFFLIHPTTGRGLYQYYFHSASVNTFCALCKKLYLDLKRSLGITKRAETLRYAVLDKPETIVESAQKLKAVKSIEFEQVSYTFYEKTFNPVARFADRIVERAVFTLPSKKVAAKAAVVRFLKKANLRKATLVGIDPDNQEVVYKLLHDHVVFAEYDYDDFMGEVNLDAAHFDKAIKTSSNIDRLITVAKSPKVKQLLETPANE